MSTIRVKTRFSSQLQQSIMYRLIGLPTGFFRRYSVGDLTSRALSVEEIEEYAGDATLTVLLTGIFGLVSFGVIVYEDGLVAAVCGSLALVTLVAFAVQAAMLVRARKKALELSGNLSGFVYQTLTGIAKIRAAAARNRIYVRWLHRFLESRRGLAVVCDAMRDRHDHAGSRRRLRARKILHDFRGLRAAARSGARDRIQLFDCRRGRADLRAYPADLGSRSGARLVAR
jgi:ABC-type multidrug transport system fused ATPase/permease subunit